MLKNVIKLLVTAEDQTDLHKQELTFLQEQQQGNMKIKNQENK